MIKNSTILEKMWLEGSNDFQHRIPQPSQASMSATIQALLDPMNRNYWNEFVDSLINRIGKTVVRSKRWDNVLRPFAQDNLPYGSTVQEIAPHWIKAHAYNVDEPELLLKLSRPEASVWYHSVNRKDQYEISISYDMLRQAFTDEYGLNNFINGVMDAPYNADAYDSYLCMKQLIAFYEKNWGFFKVHVSDITDESTGKEFLRKARAFAGKLQFPSTLYNANIIKDIPVFAKPDELVLITTPEVQANLDVETLSGLFNIDKGELKYKTVIIDEFPIPNCMALLTTADWFVVHDTLYETTSFFNPRTLTTNYYLTHWGIVSCSPFVPAIMFTTDAGTEVGSIVQTVTGFTATADADTVKPGSMVKITTELKGTLDPDLGELKVVPNSATYTLNAYRPTPADEPGDESEEKSDAGITPIQLNSRTFVDYDGILHVQKSGLQTGDVITVTAKSTYINPSGETTDYTADVSITVE